MIKPIAYLRRRFCKHSWKPIEEYEQSEPYMHLLKAPTPFPFYYYCQDVHAKCRCRKCGTVDVHWFTKRRIATKEQVMNPQLWKNNPNNK